MNPSAASAGSPAPQPSGADPAGVRPARPALALAGVHIVSLALNLPGPAALQRLRALGARCTKIEPPSGDPMRHYGAAAYAQLQRGLRCVTLDLKTAPGQRRLARLLARADVLLTAFRPAALQRLGLDAASLHARWPRLALVRIVGASGARANEAGHDLTYQAEAGLIDGLTHPTSLLADMAGALLTTEAVLTALLQRQHSGLGGEHELALADAAAWMALPRTWGLTAPGSLLGGGHVGYALYPCADGRVALAALEPHFAQRLGALLGCGPLAPEDFLDGAPAQARLRAALRAWFGQRCRAELDALARQHDLPWVTLP